MLVTFEVMEKQGELVAVHDGHLGLLVALGGDWDVLRTSVSETVAGALGDFDTEVEIELFIDANHRTRFRHTSDRKSDHRKGIR